VKFNHCSIIPNQQYSLGDPINKAFKIICHCCNKVFTPMPADNNVPNKLSNFINSHLRRDVHIDSASRCTSCRSGGGGAVAAALAVAAAPAGGGDEGPPAKRRAIDGDGGGDGGDTGSGARSGADDTLPGDQQ
jgi:hypothetical protein